ncbi:MAG TPA: prolyl oligopeptidase family serine peptidase [Candidatus Acidoferrales bacterium]|nr:prolyl oligopeptidase family serine peptidase [Candidatus Acidoferrales bacterium]
MRPHLLLVSLLALAVSFVRPIAAATSGDEALWLEDVEGKRALDWVGHQDSLTVKALADRPGFDEMQKRFLAVLDDRSRIPVVAKEGEWYYNFWRDAQHPRGLSRRTTLAEYRKDSPAWESVLDVDSLAAAEKENWYYGGIDVLPPDYTRCLVQLSRGGGDATVVREFDLTTRTFVQDGFTLPESKSTVSWIDRDRVYVAEAFDSTTMTTSGYARVVKEWRRGQKLEDATLVYEGRTSDVGVGAFHDHTPGFERDFVLRDVTFYSNELFLRRDGRLVKIEKPDDANARAWRDWLLIQLRTPWTAGGRTWPAGALLAAKFDDFVAGKRELQMVFEPGERTSLESYSPARSAVLLTELDNVRGRVEIARPVNGVWTREPVRGLPALGTVTANAVDERDSDAYWLTYTDFLTPSTLSLAEVGGGAPEPLKHSPSFFDSRRDTVTQHEAVSKDGTRVPYFEVAPRTLTLDGRNPTLLEGYGGFEVSMQPYYSGLVGRGWLEAGGVYVLANIRGGGEFGPKWHEAALKANRPRAYEDFIAVAEDLVKRRVTSPAHLACRGGSNGGLLVGNMYTRRPDLFGAVICESPLLDMKRYTKLLAGASWMGEYGDPDDPKQWAFIRTFSPYENVRPDAKYPPILITSSTRDDRVHPGHARRMTLKLEQQGHSVLYYEDVEGGHGGAANNRERAFMEALGYTFAWERVGGR